MNESLIGQLIADGRYEVLEKLGEGAMGEVYRARQVAVGRMVALKLIHESAVRSVESAARFQREMKLSAKIEHANTVRVYDFGSSHGKLFLAMELVRGQTLRSVLEQEGRLPLARIVRIGAQIARALAAAHAEHVVHRDLKPDNVMLLEQYGERDLVKVLDFGIAKSLSEPDEARMTGDGAIIGTPQYMSPEQSMAQRVDERSDLYSLGIMLFELSAGRVPFEAPSITAMLVAHATQEPPALDQVVPDVHPGLAALVRDLLQKDPGTRPRSAQEVEARLHALAAAATSSLQPAPAASSGAAKRDRAPSTRGLLALMLSSLLLGGGAAAYLWARRTPVAEAPSPPPALPVRSAPPPAPASSDWEPTPAHVVVAEQLTAADLPPPPAECAGDAGSTASALVLQARELVATDLVGAARAANDAIATCPRWSVPFNVLGNVLHSLGHLDEAIEVYGKALRLSPEYDAPRFNLGVVQLRRKDAAAIETFSALLARKPDYADARKSRAQAYLFAERYGEGLADLERAAEQEPSDGTVWLMIGQLRERLKQPHADEAYCKASERGVAAASPRCTR